MSEDTIINLSPIIGLRRADIAEASAMFYEGLEEKGYDQTRLLIQGMGKFQVRDFRTTLQ